MAKNIDKIAAGLGAKVVCKVPHTGGGAFGAAWLAKIVETIQAPRAGSGATLSDKAEGLRVDNQTNHP